MKYLTFALAKGRLAKKSLALFEQIGISMDEMKDPDTRKLIFVNEDLKIKMFLAKASDVPTYVEYGAADIGVVGKDTLLEEGRRLYEVLDLGFGKCRMCVCGPKSAAEYLQHQELIREGNYYRLSDPFQDDFAAWMVVSEDQNQALVSVVRLTAEANPVAAYVTLRGLAEDAFYLEKTTGKVYVGAALMEAGMLLPAPKGEYEAYQIMLQRVTE